MRAVLTFESAPAAALMDRHRERVREGVLGAAAMARAAGMPGVDGEGQLIRPLVSYAAALALGDDALSARFWSGVLAIQLAHEASLVHDDVVDQAAERRGAPTVVVQRGVAGALVHGDHLLTAAYRLAAATESLEFVTLFARAVERTVAGEIEQGRTAGEPLDPGRYEAIALGKAGELIGCALAVAPLVAGRGDGAALFEAGRRLGLLYQRLDDLLDYCPRTDTGKPVLGDFAQRRWTWPLGELIGDPFDRSVEETLGALRSADDGRDPPLARCLARLEREAGELRAEMGRLLPGDQLVAALVDGWLAQARDAVRLELATESRTRPGPSAGIRGRVPDSGGAMAYLAANSHSFRFATRFLPSVEAERIASVYAYCRVTDDLVDRVDGDDADALLTEWVGLSRSAYDGSPTGIGLLDRVMGEMRGAGVPFEYAAELGEGMRMDLRGERYGSLPALRRYTYRVASVVGLWLTRLSGVHDPTVLERAARLGHAMQLTNILRDVGEDWARGRLYLPAELLRRHGVDLEELAGMCIGLRPVSPAYRAVIEELMTVAEDDYRAAFEAIPSLPPYFQRPVAVAAHVYRGIHAAIRRNGYDNLGLRAVTSPAGKGVLAARALWDLRRVRHARFDGRSAQVAPLGTP